MLVLLCIVNRNQINQLQNFYFKWESSTSQKLCNCLLPEIPINQILIIARSTLTHKTGLEIDPLDKCLLSDGLKDC